VGGKQSKIIYNFLSLDSLHQFHQILTDVALGGTQVAQPDVRSSIFQSIAKYLYTVTTGLLFDALHSGWEMDTVHVIHHPKPFYELVSFYNQGIR
jgi:hypothetical protein